MKKLDKLILGSFIGPFFLTFVVVDFILLTVNMLKYFDEIFGKGLSFWIYMELISYFVISISPMALPLAVLLSSLMTFGNLGEHFELTAIKSSGISLLRAMRPIGIFVVILTIFAYLSNNYVVPKINLKTFGLLYDIRMKSPALDIKEGVFYSGIPNYSIKVNRKVDDIRLQDIIIYNHAEGQGNTNIILADSGRMEPFIDDRYMSLTLYNGTNYKENRSQRGIADKPVDFVRTYFSQNQIIFNLESFQLNRTPEDLWSTNRSIKNISQLKVGLDSMSSEINQIVYYNYQNTQTSYPFFSQNKKFNPPADIARRKYEDDSIRMIKIAEREKMESERPKLLGVSSDTILQDQFHAADTFEENTVDLYNESRLSDYDAPPVENVIDVLEETPDPEQPKVPTKMWRNINDSINQTDTLIEQALDNEANVLLGYHTFSPTQKERMDSIIVEGNYHTKAATVALNNARSIKNNLNTKLIQIDNLEREFRRFEIAWYQKYTTAFACIVMFLIGAPLGAIIKKGGMGMPVLISIIFFILYYMLTITGEKWAKEGLTDSVFGTWFSNIVLLPFGLFFLKQARRDARLFEPDTYIEYFKKVHNWVKERWSVIKLLFFNSK
jgi:lipopolysaccharide export system permease protein